MNETMLNMALMFIPKKIQNSAVVKALNFLFPKDRLDFEKKKIISLRLENFNHSWTVMVNSEGFNVVSNKIDYPDIILSSTLSILVSSRVRRNLVCSIENGDIKLVASNQDKDRLQTLFFDLSQERLDTLVKHCYAFLKLKPVPRINITSVTIDDLQTEEDIDFIRDEAVKLERRNLRESLRLMELAHQARPSGPFIKRKLEEYRIALIKNNDCRI